MDNHASEFTPEQVDAQVDRLLARPFPASQNAQIVDDLRQMYQGDERSLNTVWQRLGLENNQPSSMEKQPETLGAAHMRQQSSASAKVLDLPRNRPVRQVRKRSLPRVFSLIAAACVAALIVGSMLFISNLAQQNKNLHTASPGTPQGVYASDATRVFKLDPHTHQILWQQGVKYVAKIIPSGKFVYILQSSPSAGGTNAVMELDASSGKTLWIATFPMQKQNNRGFTRDMVLTQDRLYVGWQSVSGDMLSSAQIYVLKASDGSRLTTYPTTTSVWRMDTGAGVLAVSEESSLQVYNLTTGKALWHVSFHASISPTVVSLKITNGLIYAIVIANDGKDGPNLSSITAYKATTGEQVWQSPKFASDALSSFTVNQTIVYFGTTLYPQPGQKKPITGRIYAYDIQSNKQLWSTPVDGATLHDPIFKDGIVYFGVDSGVVDNTSPTQADIVAINAATGSLKWRQTLTGTYIGGFCLNDGAIYASSYSVSQGGITWKKSYALKASDGKMLWEDAHYGFYTIALAE